MRNIFVLAKKKEVLTDEELFELTAGILGHLTDRKQLDFIQHYIRTRIKLLKEKANV